jgi:concentrative nucleoside transporter, CNT family
MKFSLVFSFFSGGLDMFGKRFSHSRAAQAASWFVFLFCTAVILVGMLVGQPKMSVAQDAGDTPKQMVDGGAKADSAANVAGEKPSDPALVESDEPSAGGGEGRPADPAVDSPPASADAAQAGQDAAADVAKELPANKPQVMLRKVGEGDASGMGQKAISFLGIFVMIFLAWLLSNNRGKVNWRLVSWGIGLQLLFAILIFYVPAGKWVFDKATGVVNKLLEFTSQGSSFIFKSFVTGQWEPGLINFTFAVLPTIIFFSSLMTILYHLGLMQKIVYFFALIMQKTMGTSGAESLSAAANIFVGQTEAPLVVKPYVDDMTMSELMTVMAGGFATVAGGVLAIYVGMLSGVFPDIAGHLLAASVMSAPAALVIGKIMYPEVEIPVTSGEVQISTESEDVNVLDAASRGAAEGLRLALNVGAMLLAFLALIGLVNYLIGLPGLIYNSWLLEDLIAFYQSQGLALPDGCALASVKDEAVFACVETMQATAGAPAGWSMPVITLQEICGYLFAPIAWVMGVPWQDCIHVGRLLGIKMVLNELVGYAELQQMLQNPAVQLSDRSVIIATYALCGFANFGSIGIQIGGIGGIAPGRKKDLAKIAFKAMIAGTIAAFMTATIAGILV